MRHFPSEKIKKQTRNTHELHEVWKKSSNQQITPSKINHQIIHEDEKLLDDKIRASDLCVCVCVCSEDRRCLCVCVYVCVVWIADICVSVCVCVQRDLRMSVCVC